MVLVGPSDCRIDKGLLSHAWTKIGGRRPNRKQAGKQCLKVGSSRVVTKRLCTDVSEP